MCRHFKKDTKYLRAVLLLKLFGTCYFITIHSKLSLTTRCVERVIKSFTPHANKQKASKDALYSKIELLDISLWPNAQSPQRCPRTPADPRK